MSKSSGHSQCWVDLDDFVDDLRDWLRISYRDPELGGIPDEELNSGYAPVRSTAITSSVIKELFTAAKTNG